EADRDLWPAVPELIDPMDHWLAQTQGPLDRQPQQRQVLAALRARASALARRDAATDRAMARAIQRRESFLPALEALRAPAPTGPTICSVQKRRRDAVSLYQRSIDDFDREWRRAIASIHDVSECPLYRGLEIEPQIGLVPLARNPQSGLWEFWAIASGSA